MSEVKKEETKQEEKKNRQIIIETDWSDINVVKAEVAGSLEFSAILNKLLNHIK